MTWTDPTAQPLLCVRDLKLGFQYDEGLIPILHGIDFEIDRGQALGIVGESGCGKSVTWLAALGLAGSRARSTGSITLDGKELLHADERVMTTVRGRRIAMIFQDPSSSLNPAHRIGSQIGEALTLHQGLRGEALTRETVRLLDRVRIPHAAQRAKAYPHELSGGMNQRVMIAMALAGKPDLLVADEPTTALDATVQAQILELLNELRRETGMALVMISHDLGVIAQVTERVMVMYAGLIVESTETANLFSNASHPYTRGLLSALPDMGETKHRLTTIGGTVPEAGRLPSGCSFHPRCQYKVELCSIERTLLTMTTSRHAVACHRSGEVVP